MRLDLLLEEYRDGVVSRKVDESDAKRKKVW